MIPRLLLFILCLGCVTVAKAAPSYILVIDPGHGGSAASGSSLSRTLSSPNNASTPGGIKEKDLTLELSKEIRQAILFEAARRKIKCKVVLTRENDSNPDFEERTKRGLAEGIPNAVISIHFNASESHAALGSLAMIGGAANNPNFNVDKQFAAGLTSACSTAVQKFLPDSKPKAPINDGHLHGGKGSNYFFQMARFPELQKVPKCFLEVEFMDRKDVEEALIKQRQKAFPEIAASIASYLLNYVTSN